MQNITGKHTLKGVTVSTEKITAEEINNLAQNLEEKIISLRRDFHMHPELGFQETRTSKRICEELQQLEIFDLKTGLAKTGITCLLKENTSDNTKAVGLRADIDALAMQEINDVPYKSKNDGVMHSCGHDGHTAALLGAATILNNFKDRINGNVKFIFQPAEEQYGGGKDMVNEGVLENPKVDAIFSLHQMPSAPYGTISVSEGPVMASGGGFTITMRGCGCHAAYPWTGIDIVTAASESCVKLQSIYKRISALEKFVVSVTSFETSSNTYNIIPEEVIIKGTIRTFEEEVREKIISEIENILKSTDTSYGTTTEFVWNGGYPPTVNAHEPVEVIKSSADALGYPVEEMIVSMGSEDFSYYQQKIPGGYFNLGTGDGKNDAGLHNPGFDFDDKVLTRGAAMLAMCAVKFLNNY